MKTDGTNKRDHLCHLPSVEGVAASDEYVVANLRNYRIVSVKR